MTEATANATATDPLLVIEAESVLELWGHTFYSITVKRRENVLRITEPRFEDLLAEQSRLKPRKCALILGRTFLKNLVREASDDETKYPAKYST